VNEGAYQELRARAESWLTGDPDETTRAELTAIMARRDGGELVERFGESLTFGTAGLRGLLGAGPNRMNRAVVIRTSLGVVRTLLAEVPGAAERGIVVGYDARRNSDVFARDAAGVFAAAGVKVFWFDDVAPTPLTAFAVAHLGAAGGVMVTASHNPADYNGYKVYGPNGAQIISPRDETIAAAAAAAPAANAVPRLSSEMASARGLWVTIGSEVEQAYLAGLVKLLRARQVRPPFSIVYTPLHGVGLRLATRALDAAGFSTVSSVPEQDRPDPAFPTVRFPNPEEPGVLDLAVAHARRIGAELVLANDPDADRLAVAVKDEEGTFVQLSGNQVGALLGHYVITQDPRRDARAVITTIVSSPMLEEMARELGVHYEETLTGFKWIATRAIELEKEGTRFVFGYEEALGYTVGDLVRDKDGVSAAVLFAELAAVCRAQGTSVLAYLGDLYRRFGYFASAQRNLVLTGTAGAAQIAAMMTHLRGHPPSSIAGRAVRERRDYAMGERVQADGASSRLTLPASNVLSYRLDGGTRVVVRPSGTEPKLKYYVDHREPVSQEESLQAAQDRARVTVDAVDHAVRALLQGVVRV
jgi:phosphomannomutase